MDDIIKNKLSGEVIKEEPLEYGCTEPVLGYLNGIRVVIKDIDIYNEVGSYLTSSFMGLNIVPVTIMRDHKLATWSFQYYIEENTLGEYIPRYIYDSDSFQDQLDRIKVFDYLIGNDDRNHFNYLMDNDRKVWAIDNGGAFEIDPLEFKKHEPIGMNGISFNELINTLQRDKPLLDSIISLKEQRTKYSKTVSPYFSKENIKELYRRVNKIIKEIKQ